MNNMAPFVKWVGGKRQLLDELSKRMPEKYNDYYEPFIGGGALLFHLQPKNAVINDINWELIHTYTEIRDNVYLLEAFLNEMDKTQCTNEFYIKAREYYNYKRNEGIYDTELAALFIWMNKHCFNGIHRVNKKGNFNVPWNQKEYVSSIDVENIKNVSRYLKQVRIECGDFADCVASAGKEDFIYFDSPYAPLNPTSFDSYTKEGFDKNEHIRLAQLFQELTDRGCYCMLSNHDTEFVRELYHNFHIEEIDVQRAINSDSTKRSGKEVIIRNYS